MSSKRIHRRDFLKLLGLSPLLLAGLSHYESTTEPFDIQKNGSEQPNILIVVFDALSAMNMSLYGYIRKTTPNIQRASRRALIYHRNYACGNFTSPGTASLLTGVYPWSHRALHLYSEVDNSFQQKNLFHLFSRRFYTLAYSHNALVNHLFYQFQTDIREFKKRGDLALASYNYPEKFFEKDQNIAYDGELLLFREQNIDPPAAFFLSQLERLKRNFSRRTLDKVYESSFPRGIPTQSPDLLFTLEQAINWITERVDSQGKPFLLYTQLFPPHSPYNTRSDYIDCFNDNWQPISKLEHFFSLGYSHEALAQKRRHYDEYIAYLDSEFGRLYDHLEKTGALEHTYLILTADHGEMFERGILDHNTPTLYESIIKVPLLIWTPGVTQHRDIFIPTSNVDLLPTLLHVTNQAIPEWCEGDILPGLGGEDNPNRCVFSIEAKTNHKYAPLRVGTIAMIKGIYKLIQYFGYPGYEKVSELYDIRNDPNELVDLISSKRSIALELQTELQQKLKEAESRLP